jgi:hypothetical protein
LLRLNGWLTMRPNADVSAVVSVQRFSQGNLLKKTIFELIAAELLKAAAVPESVQVAFIMSLQNLGARVVVLHCISESIAFPQFGSCTHSLWYATMSGLWTTAGHGL